jgi:hypothetical protein
MVCNYEFITLYDEEILSNLDNEIKNFINEIMKANKEIYDAVIDQFNEMFKDPDISDEEVLEIFNESMNESVAITNQMLEDNELRDFSVTYYEDSKELVSKNNSIPGSWVVKFNFK